MIVNYVVFVASVLAVVVAALVGPSSSPWPYLFGGSALAQMPAIVMHLRNRPRGRRR